MITTQSVCPVKVNKRLNQPLSSIRFPSMPTVTTSINCFTCTNKSPKVIYSSRPGCDCSWITFWTVNNIFLWLDLWLNGNIMVIIIFVILFNLFFSNRCNILHISSTTFTFSVNLLTHIKLFSDLTFRTLVNYIIFHLCFLLFYYHQVYPQFLHSLPTSYSSLAISDAMFWYFS